MARHPSTESINGVSSQPCSATRRWWVWSLWLLSMPTRTVNQWEERWSLYLIRWSKVGRALLLALIYQSVRWWLESYACFFFFCFFLSSYKITNHRAFVFQTSSRPSCQEWQTWTEYGSAWKSISETWSGSISLQLNMSTLTRCL